MHCSYDAFSDFFANFEASSVYSTQSSVLKTSGLSNDLKLTLPRSIDVDVDDNEGLRRLKGNEANKREKVT